MSPKLKISNLCIAKLIALLKIFYFPYSSFVYITKLSKCQLLRQIILLLVSFVTQLKCLSPSQLFLFGFLPSKSDIVKLKSLYGGELLFFAFFEFDTYIFSKNVQNFFFYSHMITLSLFTSYNCYYLAPSLKFLVLPLHCCIPNVQLAICPCLSMRRPELSNSGLFSSMFFTSRYQSSNTIYISILNA